MQTLPPARIRAQRAARSLLRYLEGPDTRTALRGARIEAIDCIAAIAELMRERGIEWPRGTVIRLRRTPFRPAVQIPLDTRGGAVVDSASSRPVRDA